MKKFISIFVLMLIIMSVSSVFAANICTGAGGSLSETKTFTVSVGKKLFSSEKIVLTQKKGTTIQRWNGKRKIVGMYGRFYVSVYDNTANKYVYKNSKWKSGSFTIKSSKLKKNHSYTITVRGDTEQYILDSYSYSPYVFQSWSTYPTWSVKTTGSNISTCAW